MQDVFKKPEGQFGKNDTNGVYRYNPDENRQERQWIKYADGVYEPVRADGSLRRKKDDYRSFKWWGVDKPADWKPEQEGAEFSWNHAVGSRDDFADQKTGEPLKKRTADKKTPAPPPPPPLAERIEKGFDRKAGNQPRPKTLLTGGSAGLEPETRKETPGDSRQRESAPGQGGSTGGESISGMVQSKGQGRSGKASGDDPLLDNFKSEYENATPKEKTEMKNRIRSEIERHRSEAKSAKGKARSKLLRRADQLSGALKILTDGKVRMGPPFILFNVPLLERILQGKGDSPDQS